MFNYFYSTGRAQSIKLAAICFLKALYRIRFERRYIALAQQGFDEPRQISDDATVSF